MCRKIVIALLVLLGLSSCVIEHGTGRDVMRGHRILARDVERAIDQVVDISSYAIYAELMLSGKSEEAEFVKAHYFGRMIVQREASRILFRYPNNSFYTYQIVTSGKQLSDGASWELRTAADELIATFRGVENVDEKFTVDYSSNYYRDAQIKSEMTMAYDIDPDINNRNIEVEILGAGEISEEKEYVTRFEIDNVYPLVSILNRNVYVAGVVNVAYRDLVEGRTKDISMTFLPDGHCLVE